MGVRLVVALGAAFVGGLFAWIIDTGYRNSAEYKAEHLPKQLTVAANNPASQGATVQSDGMQGGSLSQPTITQKQRRPPARDTEVSTGQPSATPPLAQQNQGRSPLSRGIWISGKSNGITFDGTKLRDFREGVVVEGNAVNDKFRNMEINAPNPSNSTVSAQPLVESVVQGAGSAFSVNQQGGITAGQVFVDTHPHIAIIDDQQAAITQAMKRFDGRKATIVLNGNTKEVVDFGQRLVSALDNAKIKSDIGAGFAGHEGGTLMLPFEIQYGDNDADMAQALMHALVDNHVLSGKQIGFHYYQGTPGFLSITITPPI